MQFPSFRIPAFLRDDRVQRALKAILALGTLGYLVYLVEPSEIAAAVADAQYSYLIAALLLLPLNAWLEGLAWRRILTAVVPRAGMRQVYGAVFSGYALGLFTPARAGEFAGRALYFEQGDRWAIAGTVFVQRLLDMLAAIGFGTAALAWALGQGGIETSPAWQGALGLGIGLSVALALLLAWPGRATRYARRLVPSATVREHLDFLKRLTPLRMGCAALYSALRYGVYVTQFVLLARAFSPEAGLALLYGGIGLVFFAKFLLPSLTLMDVGIREGAAVFFLSTQLGLPQATSFNAAFLLFLVNLVLPAALGAPFLLQLQIGRGEDAASAASAGRPREASETNGTASPGASVQSETPAAMDH